MRQTPQQEVRQWTSRTLSASKVDHPTGEYARVYQQIKKLVENDIDLAGTVAMNMMIDVIFTVTDHSSEQIDKCIEGFAAALRSACRVVDETNRASCH